MATYKDRFDYSYGIDKIDVMDWGRARSSGGGGPVNYTITEIDVDEHDGSLGQFNSVTKIDSSHIFLAYNSVPIDVNSKSFSVDGSYNNITYIHGASIDSSEGTYISSCQLDDTHFVVAYAGPGYDGYVVVVAVDGSYNLTCLTPLEHAPATTNYWNSVCKIDDTHFALAYYETAGSYFKTFSVDESYNITEMDKEAFVGGRDNSLVQIDATHYILATSAIAENDSWIRTFSLDGSYNVTELNNLNHDESAGRDNSLGMFDSTHFILAYATSGNVGLIKTFSIDGSYAVTQIDSFQHDATSGQDNSLVVIDSSHAIVAYQGVDDDGFIKTFSVDGSFDNIAQVDSLEHDETYGTYNSLKMMDTSGLYYVLAYCGTDSDGYIKTFSID